MEKENSNKEWKFDLTKAAPKSTEVSLKEPLGYTNNTNNVVVKVSTNSKAGNYTFVEALEAKAWALAKSPMGSIPQTLFMFWMYGGSISIFTIVYTMHFITAPIRAIGSISQTFKQFEHKDVNLLLPKLAFFAMQLVLLGIALYKFSAMGIIPVNPADWSGIITKRASMETFYAPEL